MTDIHKYVEKYEYEYVKKYMPYHSSVRVYLCNDHLSDDAKYLLQQDCEISICSCSYENYNDCNSIEATRDHYLNCRKPPLRFQCDQYIFDIRDFHHLVTSSDTSKDATVQCDVVMIMGHSSASFAEHYNVITALAQMKPTIVAFVGCGEGNARFGPVVNMLHLLSCVCDVTPIVGFYQRRVYVSELQNTSLIVGLRYYVKLIKHFRVTADQPQIRKQIARCAFGLATARASATDPSVFINDSPRVVNFMQKTCNKLNLRLQDIPLSCMQLATCNPLIAGTEHAKIDDKVDTDNFDEWCKKEIKNRNLHELVPLMCEIDLIRPSGETLEKLRSDDASSWKEIDHLQFLIAVLRGHWGMNSSAVIKEWATFHLMEMMKDLQLWLALKDNHKCEYVHPVSVSSFYYNTWRTDNLILMFPRLRVKEFYTARIKDHSEHYLHRYKLCCMCFVLLCDDHFVRLDKNYDIIACTSNPPILDQLYDVTAGGYISTSMCTHKLIRLPHAFPDEPELPWINLYQHCRYIPNCVQLNEENQPWTIANHTYNGPYLDEWYDYTRVEFLLAMGALSDYVNEQIGETVLQESQDAVCTYDENQIEEITKLTQEKRIEIRDELKKLLENKPISELSRKIILDSPLIPACLRKRVIRPTAYCIKKFKNHGEFACFDGRELEKLDDDMSDDDDEPKQKERITFFEMKILLDCDYAIKKKFYDELSTFYKDDHELGISEKEFKDAISKANQSRVSFCRFVFAKFNNPTVPNKITGILFFTDSHYGDTILKFDPQNNHRQCKKCQCSPLKLCSCCRSKMQEITIIQARFQNLLCDNCRDISGQLDRFCNVCKKRLWQEHLNSEDKLCLKCWRKCKNMVKNVKGKSDQEKSKGWPKIPDACRLCQRKMLKSIQFPFKKIGKLTLKYTNDKLNEILLSPCIT